MTFEFKKARSNMVENVLRPLGVRDEVILSAMKQLPRHHFIQAKYRIKSYLDTYIESDEHRYTMSPGILGLLIQNAQIKKTDIVLEIGGGYGYATCILSRLADTIVLLEDKKWLSDKKKNLIQQNFDDKTQGNCVLLTQENLSMGYKEQQPYDVILVTGGSVYDIPDMLLEQISDKGGRLLFIQNKTNTRSGSGVIITRNGKHYHRKILFDTYMPRLESFDLKPDFSF